jgi:hypothetical protein
MLGAIATVPSATAAGVVSVGAAVAGIAEGATTIAAAALSERDGRASGILGWVSLGLGVASAAHSVSGAVSMAAKASKNTVSTVSRNIAVARAGIDVTSRAHGTAGQFVSTFVDDVPTWASHTMMGVSLALTAAGWGGLAREAALARNAARLAGFADVPEGQAGQYRPLAESSASAPERQAGAVTVNDDVRQPEFLRLRGSATGLG